MLPGRIDTARAAAGQALYAAGEAVWYLAGDWPARASVPVPLANLTEPNDGRALAYSGDATIGSWAVYRFAKGSWQYADRPAVSDRGMTFRMTGPGLYALLKDVGAPELECWAEPRTVLRSTEPVRHGVQMPTWEILTVAMSDAGAGIDVGSIRVWLDGIALIAEPDLPRDRLLIELPDSLTAGSHAVGIEVADRAGNVISRVLPVVCR
jgi:hypothetical protein